MWALIIDGHVRECTVTDPTGRYNSSLVWVSCPTETQPGDLYDGTTFSRPGAPSEPTLTDRRAALAAERYTRQSSGVMFQAAGASEPSLAASDAVSTGMMTSSYVAATSGHWVDGTPWKMADGSFVPLTTGDMQTMALKVLGFVSSCFAHEAELSAALATDLNTDITQGWPANT